MKGGLISIILLRGFFIIHTTHHPTPRHRKEKRVKKDHKYCSRHRSCRNLSRSHFFRCASISSTYPGTYVHVGHTFGFPFCQPLWALTKRQDVKVVANMVSLSPILGVTDTMFWTSHCRMLQTLHKGLSPSLRFGRKKILQRVCSWKCESLYQLKINK